MQSATTPPPSPPPSPLPPPPPPTQALVLQGKSRGQSLKRYPKDYNFGKVIGEGSYSTVYLAEDKLTKREYAIKVCLKQHITREKKHEQVRREKDVLNILSGSGSSFFIKLYCTFQDTERLYFVMSYAKNGDMLPYINKVGLFNMACTRFYSGEILRALEHLHDLNIMHRDLKPENILLDENMHIKVADFGCSKILEQHDIADTSTLDNHHPRTNSFVGTAQYVSPELLTEKPVSLSSDLWAFGCIIYQMIAGFPPFRSKSEYFLFEQILNLTYEYSGRFNADAKDLVQKLLVLDPTERLGTNDKKRYTSIRSHPFYNGLDFNTLHTTNPPLLCPHLPGNSEDQKLDNQNQVSSSLELSLDNKQPTRLLSLDVQSNSKTVLAPISRPYKPFSIFHVDDEEKQQKLLYQSRNSKWHGLVEGNLIVKLGLVDKRKNFSTKRRMLMLTMGPHLYYADPETMTLKGKIPWSPQLRVEQRNVSTFLVHTPKRTYYLEVVEGYALEWCKAVEEMRVYKYGVSPTTNT